MLLKLLMLLLSLDNSWNTLEMSCYLLKLLKLLVLLKRLKLKHLASRARRPHSNFEIDLKTVPSFAVKTCSWNSWNFCHLLTTLETLLKWVAISWNSWNSWCSWHSWHSWNWNTTREIDLPGLAVQFKVGSETSIFYNTIFCSKTAHLFKGVCANCW